MPHGIFTQSFELRNNKGSEKRPAVTDENDLVDVLALQEEALNRLGDNVLPSRTHEQMFLSIRNH